MLLLQSVLITGAAAALGSWASCGSLDTTSGTCCSVGQVAAPSFACNTTAACCAACFNDTRCTSWTLEVSTATASSLCTLQSSCTATMPGNCTRGELRPRPHAPTSVDASAAAAAQYATWRGRHIQQKSRWAAAWATARRRSLHHDGALYTWRHVAPWFRISRTVTSAGPTVSLD